MTHDLYKEGKVYEAFENWGQNVIVGGDDPLKDPVLTRTVWEEIVDHAENHNIPGQFTALIGYEWSSGPGGNNLHRVVVMRDSGSEAKKALPFAAYESDDPEKLWDWMEAYEEKTDAHTSLSTTREDNYFGKVSLMEPGLNRFEGEIVPDPHNAGTGTYEFETIASGLQGIWAKENTRAALWDAMKRKETYATTGSRMTVRVFGGWEYRADDVLRPDFAKTGYMGGVPMGGDLRNAPEGMAPKLMIRSLPDPDGANLDRIQIINGWTDSDGQTQEFVYDAVCSEDRKIVDARCESAVGNTVNIEDAT